MENTTNQIFPIMEDAKLEVLKKDFGYCYQQRVDENRSAVRFCTSWATKEENVLALLEDMRPDYMGEVSTIPADTKPHADIYTDGAARGNPDGPGGYGTVLEYVDSKGNLHVREFSCGYKKTTNNRMELMAAIVGLEALNRPCDVKLYSDSKYLVDAFNQVSMKQGYNTLQQLYYMGRENVILPKEVIEAGKYLADGGSINNVPILAKHGYFECPYEDNHPADEFLALRGEEQGGMRMS